MNFSEYYNIQEDINNVLNEDAVAVAVGILGVLVAANLAAYGLNLLFYAQAITFKKISLLFKKTKKEFKSAFSNQEKIDIQQITRDPRVVKQRRELEKVNNKFEDELKDLYEEVMEKDFENAKAEFKALDPSIKNNLEVQRAIIAKITDVLKEPPLYVRSPGNKTYQAIKKVINIRVAQASAKAVERALYKLKEGKGEEGG